MVLMSKNAARSIGTPVDSAIKTWVDSMKCDHQPMRSQRIHAVFSGPPATPPSNWLQRSQILFIGSTSIEIAKLAEFQSSDPQGAACSASRSGEITPIR